MIKAKELMSYEYQLLQKGYKYICGIDEVGRGPLAGPVCVSAVIMPLDHLIEGINDSKKVSKTKREQLFELIKENAISTSTIMKDSIRIDKINILNATKEAMTEAILSLDIKPDIVLIDAVKLDIPFESLSIIHGDALSYSIAAASILAKVTRDKLMEEFAKQYPGYDFEHNMGYGTKKHIEGLKALGATPIHRQTFIKNFINTTN